MLCCTASSVDHRQSETEAFPLQKPTDAVTINRLQIDNVYSDVSRTLPGSLIEYPSGNRFSAKDGPRSACTTGVFVKMLRQQSTEKNYQKIVQLDQVLT